MADSFPLSTPNPKEPETQTGKPAIDKFGQRIVVPASDDSKPFPNAKSAAEAVAKIIKQQADWTTREYGAIIYRRADRNGRPLGGYTYGPVVQGPPSPSVSAVLLRKERPHVLLDWDTNPTAIASSLHNHIYEFGSTEDRDNDTQTRYQRREVGSSPAFSNFDFQKKNGDIESYIKSQWTNRMGNAYPMQQEHFLLTPQSHLWSYKPPQTPVSGATYKIPPERFTYYGQLANP